MKIALITLHTPTATNHRGASALPYHIIKYRNIDIETEIWTYNINECSAELITQTEETLNVKIHLVPKNQMMGILESRLLRFFLPYPVLYYRMLPNEIICDIDAWLGNDGKNGVWIYGEDIAHHISNFPQYRCVVTTPDCEAMYYYRELSHRGQFTRLIPLFRNAIMYNKYARMAEAFPTENVRYHLVGKEDSEFLKNINPMVDATFINHPHYDYSDKKVIKFSQPKIKLLIAGRYDLYMKDKCDELFEAMIKVAQDLKELFVITFLGKDWDIWREKLSFAGYDVDYIRFAPDYMEELIKHDIQITPIGIGTGTKGKVLDAFANGLMVMGTLRALENIQVVNGESCVLYDKAEDAINALRDISASPWKYEQMAKAGREAVLDYHDSNRISQQFFNLFDLR